MESVEAICSIAHVASEDEIRGRLQRLPSKVRRRLSREVGVISCHRAIVKNPDVGVVRAFLEQREIQENVNQHVPDKSSGTTTLLHAAVLRQDGGEAVKMLLELPEVDVNVIAYKDGYTALHLACLLSRFEIVELLLNDRRVDLSAKTLDNRTALHCTCSDLMRENSLEFDKASWGSTCKKLEVVRILMKATATRTGNLLRFLDERDSCGKAALHYASENNHRAIVEEIFRSLMLITDAGIESSNDAMLKTSGIHEHLVYSVSLAQDIRGFLPVHLAAQKGHREVVKCLLRHAPHTLHSQDRQGLTPFHHSIIGGHLQIVEDWMSQHIPKSNSLLLEQKLVTAFVELFRITTHHRVALFLLQELEHQLQASSPTRRNFTSLLHWTLFSPTWARTLIPHILKWQPTLANKTLDPQRKQTPLHISTISNQLDTVTALCTEEGWSLQANKKDKFNKTALDYAHDLGHKDICEHLTQRPDVKNFLSNLQEEQMAFVTAANAILVVAVLIAGSSFADCTKPLYTNNPPSPDVFLSLYVVASTTFLTSISATILGACAALPFSFGLYIGKRTKRCDLYIAYKVRRIRVLVASASYFLVMSLATMVFSFLCSSFGGGVSQNTRLVSCLVFTASFTSVSVLVFVVYISRALYCKLKHLRWRKSRKLSKMESLLCTKL
ncbi:hypothetical protein M758_10G073400 [Ceratodon purpureus]|nr:hypothetical protein M758_10G073400 [Ceratodon purpureus]